MREFLHTIYTIFAPPAKTAAVFIATTSVAFWIGAPTVLQTLLAATFFLFLTDLIVGSGLALYDHRFSSRRFGKSITKLAGFVFAMLISVPIGYVLAALFPVISTYLVMTAFVALIFVKEAASCLEFAKALGVPIPVWISVRLADIDRSSNADPIRTTTTTNTVATTTCTQDHEHTETCIIEEKTEEVKHG